MSSRHPSQACIWTLRLLAVPLLLVRCSGTEADNPVTDVVVTACKAKEVEYDPEQVEHFLSQHSLSQHGAQQTAGPVGGDVRKSVQPPGALPAALTPTADFPVGLSCVEWQLSGNSLALQIVNFDSNCGAEWQGKANLDGERLKLTLDNRGCAVSACGTCLYDTASVIELPAISDIQLQLSLNVSCEGEPELRDWQLPLTQAPRGRICEFAHAQGLGAVRRELFLDCDFQGNCDAGLSCLPVGVSETRCVPACSVDADCPFPVGTRCDAGYCVPASIP